MDSDISLNTFKIAALTLALSQGERGLIEVAVKNMYIHQNQVGSKAAFVGKPTPTKAKAKAKAKAAREVRIRFSPLNTMSVSSSTAFDVPAPSAG
ncbi:hypothetical protein [Pseudomonas koreensis]|uniref:Uncharacterized protein n=1 Tax=Pseudomonas koreensis TaxID=198620 RepID=A0A9X2XT66_9PSED|nr:hypothetical protein [Pseudomonas koreensis]MCU7251909.1 hypothetical protein [Pseudomonas koreensis]